jgi:hypothetical protein
MNSTTEVELRAAISFFTDSQKIFNHFPRNWPQHPHHSPRTTWVCSMWFCVRINIFFFLRRTGVSNNLPTPSLGLVGQNGNSNCVYCVHFTLVWMRSHHALLMLDLRQLGTQISNDEHAHFCLVSTSPGYVAGFPFFHSITWQWQRFEFPSKTAVGLGHGLPCTLFFSLLSYRFISRTFVVRLLFKIFPRVWTMNSCYRRMSNNWWQSLQTRTVSNCSCTLLTINYHQSLQLSCSMKPQDFVHKKKANASGFFFLFLVMDNLTQAICLWMSITGILSKLLLPNTQK